eukprot:364196-Chlamydomonas_euryale.AAC.5
MRRRLRTRWPTRRAPNVTARRARRWTWRSRCGGHGCGVARVGDGQMTGDRCRCVSAGVGLWVRGGGFGGAGVDLRVEAMDVAQQVQGFKCGLNV